MRRNARSLWTYSLLVIVGVWAHGVLTRTSGAPPRGVLQPDVQAQEDADAQADALGARWEAEYDRQALFTGTRIEMRFSRAFSSQFTDARGHVELNFLTGRVSVSVNGLDAREKGFAYEVWLVDQAPGAEHTAAIDLGDQGDLILNLGALTADGSLVTTVRANTLATRAIDVAAVMRVTPNGQPEYVIGGMQSIRTQFGRVAYMKRRPPEGSFVAAGFNLTLPNVTSARSNVNTLTRVRAQSGTSKKQLAALITQGRDLFFNGAFGGNGRTCGTCHQADRNLSIDSAFIAGLARTDPLFVAEFDPNLPPFDAASPLRPAMEDPALMRTRGLILENIRGFEIDPVTGELVEPPVFRQSPSLFNLEFTAPYGLSDCCPSLQDFSAGAVVQHFTKTLSRVPGVDFVLPTAAELQALEAFQLSNASPTSRNFKIAGRNSLLSTATDPRAIDTTRSEVRGRELFLAVGCTTCHSGTVFSGGPVNLNTGVEAFERDFSDPAPTVDTGDGLGQFQIPQLFGLRKDLFVHTGRLGNSTVAIPGETLRFTNIFGAVRFYVTGAFAQSPEGQTGLFQSMLDMTDGNITDIAHFLESISVR